MPIHGAVARWDIVSPTQLRDTQMKGFTASTVVRIRLIPGGPPFCSINNSCNPVHVVVPLTELRSLLLRVSCEGIETLGCTKSIQVNVIFMLTSSILCSPSRLGTKMVSQIHTFSLVLVAILVWSAIAPLPATADLTVKCVQNPPRECTYIGEDALYVCSVRGSPNGLADISVSPARQTTFNIVTVPGGQNVPFIFQNVSLADNQLTHCVAASTPRSYAKACFQVRACIPNILNCRVTNYADWENCTDIGMDVQFHCTARGPELSLDLPSPTCRASVGVQEVAGGEDLSFTFRNLSPADNGKKHCISARTTHEQQSRCLNLAVCPPKPWIYLPATLGKLSRSSIARRDVSHTSYQDAVRHCTAIGYQLGSEQELLHWRDALSSELTSIARDSTGPYYIASSAANPRVVILTATGTPIFTDARPGKLYRSLCFVLCDNGFMDTSVPSAPACRCLSGWLGERCEKRAVAGFLSKTTWVAPSTGFCKPTDTTPLQCAQNGRYPWHPAQVWCDRWYSSIATQLPLHSSAAPAFHRFVSQLVVAGYHDHMSVWLNNTGTKSLYSLGREALSAPHITSPVTGDPAADVICEADWTNRVVRYRPWNTRVAMKSAPAVSAANLWMIQEFCPAMNMSMPQATDDPFFIPGLFSNAMPQLGVAGPPFYVPVWSQQYSSIQIAKILSATQVQYISVSQQATYSPVCIKLCSSGQSLNSYNECI
ncbi:uncharacterized protein LOC135821677 [Sycon ciliatum]|uniref:uncharacterized protein LOC135821677 n=1 Tax=Sycon ciliatum TaxID=27933 RepID=UPI0031F611FC